MKSSRTVGSIWVLLFWIGSILPLQATDWKQWAGPNRNFSVEGGPLATEWPEGGPPEIWSRPLGDGFSSILFENGRLYTTYRRGDSDVAIALDAETGATIWETAYESPTTDDMILDFGPGPISTPLLAGDLLFSVTSTVRFQALAKESGAVVWSRDLRKEMEASHLGRGYGPSPLAYKDLVIVNVGGKEKGVVAFRQQTGEEVWSTRAFGAGYSSPILATVDGVQQVIIAMGPNRAGIDPDSGELLWHLELPSSAGTMMATQIYNPDDHLLFASIAYADGSRAIEVRRKDGKFQAEEVWYNRKMRVMFPSYVRIGDHVYGTSGDFGPAFLVAMNVKTGEVAWRKRGFARTHFVHADGKVILLEEEGDLAIATATPEELTVHARARVIDRTAWTPPTLVGSRLFLRNRSTIKALELGHVKP